MEGRALPEHGFDPEIPVVLADNGERRGEPKPAAVALGGEVRVKDAGERLSRDAQALILNGYLDIFSRVER